MRYYGKMERAEDGWRVTAIEPHVALKLKAIFPRIAKTARPPFHLRGGTTLDADLSWFISRYPLEMAPEHMELLGARKTLFDNAQLELADILSKDWRPTKMPRFRKGRAPYPYQMQAAELARRKGRLLLLDEIGLGKTISALAAICDAEFLPAIVVVQSHLADQWKEEYIEDFTHLKAHIIKGTTPYSLPPADVYIFRYSNIAGWVDYIEKIEFRSLILDECQEVRHGTRTAKGAAIAAFALAPTLRLKMGLTGTPIYNYGSEIFNVLEPLEQGALGSWHEFIIEWCAAKGTHWIVKEPDALGTYLIESHLALRRTQDDVGEHMPPVNTVVHTVRFDEEIAASADQFATALAAKVVSDKTEFTERGRAARELETLMRRVTGLAKAQYVAAFVRILLNNDVPVLLVGWHRDVYDIWLKELAEFKPMLYTGSESSKQKTNTKKSFVGGATNLMILSLRSGVGLDGLQFRGWTVVFGEIDWSPQVHRQVIGRLRRAGQERQVDAIYLVCDDGSDPTMIETLGLKASQSRALLDPMRGAEQQFTDESRIKRLAEAYLAGRRMSAKPVTENRELDAQRLL